MNPVIKLIGRWLTGTCLLTIPLSLTEHPPKLEPDPGLPKEPHYHGCLNTENVSSFFAVYPFNELLEDRVNKFDGAHGKPGADL